jgi:hypothetical protein
MASPDVTVAVDCPGFDAEGRAALDARARADLLVRNDGGTLVIVCRGSIATLSWHPLTGAPSTSATPITDSTRSSIDGVLEALDVLLAPPAANEEETPVVAPEATPPEATAPPLQPKPAELAPPRAQMDSPAVDRSTVVSRGRRSVEVVLGAGTAAEFWTGTAALGVRGLVAIPLPLRLAAGATGTVLWDLASPSGVNARLSRVALGGEYGVDRAERFRVGADGFVEFLHAASGANGADDKTAFGGAVHASAALLLKPVRIQAGPIFELRPNELRVQLGASDALAVTHFTFGLAVDVAFGPYP